MTWITSRETSPGIHEELDANGQVVGRSVDGRHTVLDLDYIKAGKAHLAGKCGCPRKPCGWAPSTGTTIG